MSFLFDAKNESKLFIISVRKLISVQVTILFLNYNFSSYSIQVHEIISVQVQVLTELKLLFSVQVRVQVH